MTRLRRHLTFANVVACLALFVALGGASYAALKVPKESVGTEQLKKAAVTPEKLSDKAKDAMTGPRGPQGQAGAKGAQGPQGASGAQGPPGEPGPSAVYAYFHKEEVVLNQYTYTVASLPVPAGSYAIQAELLATSMTSELADLTCELHAGADDDERFFFLDNNNRYAPSATLWDNQVVPFQLVHTFGEPSQITISCVYNGPSTGVAVRALRITAIKVGQVAANIVS
jgi:hypothetical protein